jgi:glycopeptide antibiotics resistance protein
VGFLFGFAIALILYGTLYPFDFTAGAHAGGAIFLLIESIKERPGRGDVLSNVVLFLPFGFFGMQCLLPKIARPIRLIVVVILGGALSFTIECTQVYLPDRVTSIYDFILNTGGSGVGGLVGWMDWRGQLAKLRSDARPPTLFPVLLGGAWLGYRLFPYVPTIDFQHVKDAIKPLLYTPVIGIDVLRHFVVTLVVARLLQALLPPGRALLAAIVISLGAVAAKPFIMTKVIMASEAIGVIAGVAVWVVLLSRVQLRTPIVAALLAVQIAVQGLLPFTLRAEPVMFSFIPFIGFEGGSMAVNLQAFLEKNFLYGALVWLTVESGVGLIASAVACMAFLTGIEVLQMFLDGRTSEITDPLLALLMTLTWYFVDLRPNAKEARAKELALAT